MAWQCDGARVPPTTLALNAVPQTNRQSRPTQFSEN